MDLKKSSMSWLNIQQQVQKNKDDIAAWNDVDKFGIKVKGKVDDAGSLPDPTTYQGEYGDTYAVGTETPYDYYVFTRPESGASYPSWFNVGQLQIKGDKGDQGETGPAGPTGDRGSIWTTSNANPSIMSTTKKNDQHLCVYNGDIFQFDGSAWNRIGNIRGPQGIQGVQGLQGPKGDTGETGPKGDTGDVGGFINIVATLTSADLLPDPATLDNLTYAYLVGDNNDLYIQVGKTSDVATWKNMGSFNMTANHWTVNTSNQLVPANNDDVALNNLTVLGSTSLKSPSISGVTACSAIASPATLTFSGTSGIEQLVNGTTVLNAQSDGVYFPTIFDPGDDASYPVAMVDSSGKLLKCGGINVNPYTKTLTASSNITAVGGVNASGFYYGSRNLVSDIDSKLSKNTSVYSSVYASISPGKDTMIGYSAYATANCMMTRNENAQAQVKPLKNGPAIYTDSSNNNYIATLAQLAKMHKYDSDVECWSNTLIIGDLASPKDICLNFFINGNGDQCPIWMFQLSNGTDTGTYNWADLDSTVLLPHSNTIYWLGGYEPVFEYGKRYTLMFWPADSSKVDQAAGSEYTGALIGTWSAA